ncbi:uncharacterized protein [Nicotiana sylvestris]|uniref:uncharacterized protein n=1 Tax=Nicotiana sylvestris TaxID=4096 RepID=UPI00388C8787
MPESSYPSPAIQGSSGRYLGPQSSSGSYFSAILESLYRPLAIQASSSGSTGHQGQILGQQVTAPWGCFECSDLGHMRRYCPRLRPPRSGGQTGRGHTRGGSQAGRGQPTTAQTDRGRPAGAPARFYAFPARPNALASDAIITGIISVCGRDASVLFDPGPTYSYVSSLFAHFLDIPHESLGNLVHVSIFMGNSVVVDQIYQSCVVIFFGFETREYLMLLDMTDFEVILGMDWLSPYHVVLDFYAKTVILAMLELPRLEWKGSSVSSSSQVISF